MRKFLISLLLASAAAATPALAEPRDGRSHFNDERQDARAEARAERQQAREQRSQAHEQAQPSQQPSPVQVNRPSQTSETRGSSNDRPQVRSFDGGAARGFNGARMERSANRDSSESVRGSRSQQIQTGSSPTVRDSDIQDAQDAPRRPTNWRRHERQVGNGGSFAGRADVSNGGAEQEAPTSGGRTIQWRRAPGTSSGDLVQPDRPLPRVLRTRTPIVSNTPREGTQPPARTDLRRRTTVTHWDSNWRHNSRYNWSDWRRRHHSFFRLGLYYDPFGWGYRRYSIGWRLWPAYFGSRFWINDPWYYRLPYAPPGYRWIRYYDDLILVDTWDGRVVDVIYDFFW